MSTTVRVGKTYTIDCAHQLLGHRGKCARLHGHTYIITVWVKGQIQESPGQSYDGMVLDFTDIDGVVKPILERMDHHFLAKGDEPAWGGYTASDVCCVGVRTTAENLAVWLWKQIVPLMAQTQNIDLLGVKVQETPNTFAEYIAEVRPRVPLQIVDEMAVRDAINTLKQGEIKYETTPEAWVRSN